MITVAKAVSIGLAAFACGMAITNLLYVISDRISLFEKCNKKRGKGNNGADNSHS